MKTIIYKLKQKVQSSPLWMPWGAMGCLWRVMLFLALLFLLFMLLSMLRSCDDSSATGTNGRTPIHRHRYDLPDDILNPRRPTTPVDSDNPGAVDNPIGEDPRNPNDGYSDPEAPGANENIPGNINNPGPHLPPPEANRPRPIEDDNIVDDDENGSRVASNRLNVILDSDATDETFKNFAQQFKSAYPGNDYEILFYNTYTKLIQLGVPPSERERVKQELPGKIQGISFRVFDETIFSGAYNTPNDPAFRHREFSWYLAPIQAYEAWEITQGSPDVVVAIVDSYFDMTHDELEQSRIVSPYSVPLNSTDVRPSRSCPQSDPAFLHGSAVAAQAVGSINNNAGLCGIAPKCKLMPISMGHQFTSMTMLQGILYAIYQGADVVNVSAGMMLNPEFQHMPVEDQINFAKEYNKDGEDIWQFAFDIADKRNVTIVWAAGNENYYSGLDYSKRGENTIRVAAVDKRLKRADFSNYGNFDELGCHESTVSAPGTEILCAMPFNTYCSGDGTSYSAPIVTGAIALMKSIDPTLTNRKIIEILQETGKPIAGSPEIGPLLQIKDALLKVQGAFVNHEDIMNDHQQLVGTWQTVQELHAYDADGRRLDEKVLVYFQVHDTNKADIKIYEHVTSKHLYKAKTRIKWDRNNVCFIMNSEAKSPNTAITYAKNIYTCTSATNGKLQCYHINGNDTVRYMLKKISNNPNIDITSYE